MEALIFTGLLISGYLSNQCNQSNKLNNNNKIPKKLLKKLHKQQKKLNLKNNNNKNNNIDNNEKLINELQEDLFNNINEDLSKNDIEIETEEFLEKENQTQKKIFKNELNNINEPLEYNKINLISNITEENDDISGRNKLKQNNPSIISKLTGKKLEFNHNNMQHFYGSSVTQNMDLNKPNRHLNLFTGGQDLKESKKEIGSMFEPERQNIFGTQNYTEQYKNNLNQSRYENHNLPFEQKTIGPGIGLDYDDKPTGGFHQDNRKYELPKTIDELRAKNNPRVTYKGRIIKGKKEIKRDSGYYFTKGKKVIMEVDRNQLPTYGVGKETKRSDIYIKDNNRKNSKEVMGPAGSVNSKEYKTQNYRPSNKLKLDVDTNRNVAGDTKYDFDKKAYNCPESKREEQATEQYRKKLYIANLLKALIPTTHYQDKARNTIKETTEVNKELLNLKGNEKIKMYNKQPARKTIRETTENNVKDILNIKLYNKLPERVKQKIRTTLRETLLDNNHSGYISMDKKKSTLRNMDKLKTTLKETLLRDSELLNMLAGYKGTKQFEDSAKLTHKETYTQNYTVGGAAENRNDGYKSSNFEMTETNKETYADKQHFGIGDRENATGYMTNEYEAKETNKETYADKDHYGPGLGDREMMSYEDMYNATINELKEKTLKGRAPTKEGAKTAISSKDINMDIKCDLLRKGEEPKRKTLIHNTILDKNSIVSTSNKNNSIEDIIKYNEEKKTTDITDQLDKNPFAISIV